MQSPPEALPEAPLLPRLSQIPGGPSSLPTLLPARSPPRAGWLCPFLSFPPLSDLLPSPPLKLSRDTQQSASGWPHFPPMFSQPRPMMSTTLASVPQRPQDRSCFPLLAPGGFTVHVFPFIPSDNDSSLAAPPDWTLSWWEVEEDRAMRGPLAAAATSHHPRGGLKQHTGVT